jgi:AcrR family transcriptional regulator
LAVCDCTWEKDDARSRKTRAALSNSLIELLLERGWEAIGVRELCVRAGVARSTFYLHYRNKEELLEDGFNGLRDMVRQSAPKRTLRDTGRFGFAEGVAAHIFENRKMFLAIAGGNGGGVVRERFRSLISGMAAEELQEAGAPNADAAHFLSGGFVSLAVHIMTGSSAGKDGFLSRFHALAGRGLTPP